MNAFATYTLVSMPVSRIVVTKHDMLLGRAVKQDLVLLLRSDVSSQSNDGEHMLRSGRVRSGQSRKGKHEDWRVELACATLTTVLQSVYPSPAVIDPLC